MAAPGLVAMFWQPIGAGNSIAWMGLAGAVFALATRTRGNTLLLAMGVAGLASAAALKALGDIHGPPIFVGACLAVGFGVKPPGAR